MLGMIKSFITNHLHRFHALTASLIWSCSSLLGSTNSSICC
jgi:hypothetical protein